MIFGMPVDGGGPSSSAACFLSVSTSRVISTRFESTALPPLASLSRALSNCERSWRIRDSSLALDCSSSSLTMICSRLCSPVPSERPCKSRCILPGPNQSPSLLAARSVSSNRKPDIRSPVAGQVRAAGSSGFSEFSALANCCSSASRSVASRVDSSLSTVPVVNRRSMRPNVPSSASIFCSLRWFMVFLPCSLVHRDSKGFSYTCHKKLIEEYPQFFLYAGIFGDFCHFFETTRNNDPHRTDRHIQFFRQFPVF